MESKQARLIGKKFGNSIVNSWFVILTILGVLIFATSFFVDHKIWSKAFFSVGTLIVVSGCFSAMVRWLTVHEIVKTELESILFGEEYLEEEAQFNSVWNKLVSTAIKKHMPSLSSSFHKEFLRGYLPSKNELYYKSYHQFFDVYWEDKNNRIIRIIEKVDITISTNSTARHILPYRFSAESPKDMSLEHEIQTLKINGECQLSKVETEITDEDNIVRTDISYKLPLNGHEKYRYFRKMVRRVSLDYEPFIVVGSGWHTYKPKVTINCHRKGIKAYFTSTGTLCDFVTIDGCNNSPHMEEEYPELMMKAQGYSIYFAST